MSASAAPVISVRENVPSQQVIINTAAPVVSENVMGQQVVTSASVAQHEQSVAETEDTTPQSPQSVTPFLQKQRLQHLLSLLALVSQKQMPQHHGFLQSLKMNILRWTQCLKVILLPAPLEQMKAALLHRR